MSFNHYKVEGYDKPLRLSEAHAKQIGAERVKADGTPVEAPAEAVAGDTPAGGGDTPATRKRS